MAPSQFFRAVVKRRDDESGFNWGITPQAIRAKIPNLARLLGDLSAASRR